MAGMSIHQPRTKIRERMHSSRIAIAIEYLSMRACRSASGEGGRDVMEGCFMAGIAAARATPPAYAAGSSASPGSHRLWGDRHERNGAGRAWVSTEPGGWPS